MAYMFDPVHQVNILLPCPLVVFPKQLLAAVLLPCADVPVMAHSSQPALGDPPEREEDWTFDEGGMCSSIALPSEAALDTEPTKKIFGTCCSLAKLLYICDVCS